MFKLIKIELKKILKKKSIFIMMIIMLLFNLLNNILFYTDYDKEGNYKYLEINTLESEKKLISEELKKYDYYKESDINIYINLKTKLDIIKLQEKHYWNTWQYNKTKDYLYNTVENINIYKYKIKDDNLLKEKQQELEILLKKFEENDWKYFINIEIKNLERNQKDLKKQLENETDISKKENLKTIIEDNDLNLEILKYRLKNKIKEDNNFVNTALKNYKDNINKIKYYENNKNLTKQEKVEYQTMKKKLEENKYILKTQINYNQQNTLNYQLRTIVDDYEIFIIITILIIASTIVAEEFQTGTIKLLLIKPFSRGKIILSKYLTIIIVLLFIIIYLILLQLIIGGIIFGFSSLDIPVIVYNLNKDLIIEYNVFIYMSIRIIAKIPLLLLILTISFSFSTITNSLTTSLAIPLFIYILSPSITNLMLHYKIKFLKYFVNINWNFNDYLFGYTNEIEGISLKFSLMICIIYYIIIIIFTYFNFKKKNIKNV